MPNWCNNSLVVEGPTAEVRRFRDEVKSKSVARDGSTSEETPLSFNKHVPLYDEVTGEFIKKDLKMGDVYDSWGTKWDVNTNETYFEDDTADDQERGSITYGFDTAWGPASDWFEAVVALFPKLSFEIKYQECGCDIYGVATGEEGSVSVKDMTKEEYLIEWNEEYTGYIEEIKNMSTDELVKYFSGVKDFNACLQDDEEWNEELSEKYDWGDMYDFQSLDKYIVEKIDVKDLPLFMNVEWASDEAIVLFKERLSKGE